MIVLLIYYTLIITLSRNTRYDHDDERFRNMLKNLDMMVNNEGSQNMFRFFLPLWFLKFFSVCIYLEYM